MIMYYVQMRYNERFFNGTFPNKTMATEWLGEIFTQLYLTHGLDSASTVEITGWDITVK